VSDWNEEIQRMSSESLANDKVNASPFIDICPFCSTQPQFTCTRDMTDNFDHGYTLFCEVCGIEMHDEYESEVIERWNKRPGIIAERQRAIRSPNPALLLAAKTIIKQWDSPLGTRTQYTAVQIAELCAAVAEAESLPNLIKEGA